MSTSSVTPLPIFRAAIANLGCKVNQAEMNGVERLLRGAGVQLVDIREVADLVVINTCTVTSMADAKSRQLVRRARRTSPDALVLVTGCAVAVEPELLAAADPAARFYDNDRKGRLLAETTELLGLPDGVSRPTLSGVEAAPGLAGVAVTEAAGDRTRAFVKVQDGCSFHCTYCIIPELAGPSGRWPRARSSTT